LSAVLAVMSIREERPEVRLRHHGDDAIVLDFDTLKDEPRQVVPLFRSCHCPGRREIAEKFRRLSQCC
jgi:hypothetical protein